jgi:hypothetical protein
MSYIGANSQGIIGVANTDIIDGSTIQNATLESSVTFPAGHTISYHVSTLTGTEDTDTSTAFTDTGAEITIPEASVALGSKILLTFNHMFRIDGGTDHRLLDLQIIRTSPSSTTLQSFGYIGVHGTAIDYVKLFFDKTIVDSSLGTGAHTYKLQFRKAGGNANNAGSILYKASNQNTHYIFARVIQ